MSDEFQPHHITLIEKTLQSLENLEPLEACDVLLAALSTIMAACEISIEDVTSALAQHVKDMIRDDTPEELEKLN